MMSASNIVQAQEDDLKCPRGERIPFQQLDDNSNNVVTTNQRYAGAKKNMDHHSYHHQYRHRDEYEYESNDQRNIDEDQELRTKRPNSPKIMGLSQQQQHHHHQRQRGEVNYLSQPPPFPPPPPSYHGPHAYEGDPYVMLRPPLSYMAEFYPPYHQSYPKSHMDIDSETGADTDNAVNKTSTAAVLAQRPSPPTPQQTNYHYCPSLSGNDRSSTNSNDCNYEYDDVIKESGINKDNSTNTNTNDFNICRRLLEGRKSDSNDNNDSNNVFLSNAMSSNFSSASSGNDSAPAAIKHPCTISDTNKRRKLDSSNKNATATTYDVTNIIAKKDGTVHNVRPVAVSYTQKRGNGGGGGGGGVLPSSTSATANHRQKEGKYHKFEDRLAQLADYKEKNGHCIVLQSFQGYGNLGHWVNRLRQEYKKYKENKPSSTTTERICALEKLGFRWKIVSTKFDDRLEQLADYKEKNGHCIVPKSFQGYGNLGHWVSDMRQEYKKYKESKPSSMTNERISALEKLDFKWRLCTKLTFEDRLVQLADYKEKNGHCIVPQRYKGYENLGQWVNNTKTQYKKYKENKPSNNITKERIRALEELDFKWQGKRGPAFGTLSLLAQQENDDNEVVAVARSVPTLEAPPTELVVDAEKEDQIEREDDDQLFGDNTMTSSNDGDSDKDIGEDNVYRVEGDDHHYGNFDHDGGDWHDLGDDFDNSDDDCLVF